MRCEDDFDGQKYGDYTWIEGVGDLGGLLAPKHYCSAEIQSELLCFKVSGQTIYNNESLEGCWLISDTDLVDNEQFKASIFPNPVNDVINIKCSSNSFIEKKNALGKKILFRDCLEKIDIEFLPNGIYYLSLLSDKKQQLVKFIKI